MRRRQPTESASALMLVPAGVLILLILGAIAVDSSLAFMAQRELHNAAIGAVNDAVTVSIGDEALQRGTEARPNGQRASALVHDRLDGLRIGRMTVLAGDVQVVTDEEAKTVTVRVEGDMPYLFAPAVPGSRRSAHVVAQTAAQLQFRAPQ